MTISRKVLFGSLTVSVISVLLTALITSAIGYSISKGLIEGETKNTLISQRESQKDFISSYLKSIEHDLIAFSSSHSVKTAAEGFLASYNEFPRRVGEKLRDAKLTDYYENQFGSTYANSNPESSVSPKALLDSLSDKAKQMQYHFIANNDFPLGEKDSLNTLDFDSSYNNTHKNYHPEFRQHLQVFSYYDIFLIDAKSGEIIYSVFKELDYATSLIDGPYKDSDLAKVYR